MSSHDLSVDLDDSEVQFKALKSYKVDFRAEIILLHMFACLLPLDYLALIMINQTYVDKRFIAYKYSKYN